MQLGASGPLPSHPSCAAGGRGGPAHSAAPTDASWPQPGSGVKGSDIAEVRSPKDTSSYSGSVSTRLVSCGLWQHGAGRDL